jgi:hypothetical protein
MVDGDAVAVDAFWVADFQERMVVKVEKSR